MIPCARTEKESHSEAMTETETVLHSIGKTGSGKDMRAVDQHRRCGVMQRLRGNGSALIPNDNSGSEPEWISDAIIREGYEGTCIQRHSNGVAM